MRKRRARGIKSVDLRLWATIQEWLSRGLQLLATGRVGQFLERGRFHSRISTPAIYVQGGWRYRRQDNNHYVRADSFAGSLRGVEETSLWEYSIGRWR